MNKLIVVGALVGGLALVGPRDGIAGPLSQPLTATGKTAEESQLLHMVHGCHRTCRRGPLIGVDHSIRWHRHVGQYCVIRVGCRPN